MTKKIKKIKDSDDLKSPFPEEVLFPQDVLKAENDLRDAVENGTIPKPTDLKTLPEALQELLRDDSKKMRLIHFPHGMYFKINKQEGFEPTIGLHVNNAYVSPANFSSLAYLVDRIFEVV